MAHPYGHVNLFLTGYLIFIFDKGQGFINGVQGQFKVFSGVSVTDIGVVKGGEKETFPDELGVKSFRLPL